MLKKPATIFNRLIPLSIALLSFEVQALVDYSEAPQIAPAAPVVRPMANQSATSTASSSSLKQNSGSSGMFDISLSYESLSVKQADKTGDATLMRIDSHFQTPYSFFLDLSYWRLNSISSEVDQQERADNGNPLVKLGFNWLQFGKGHDATTVDLYAGYSFKSSNGVASSRDDQIVGIETAKRFYDFALAVGFEYQLTGSPSDSSELEIGNIQKILASLGWMVSHDIHFVVEGANVKVKEASEVAPNKLNESFSYSYVNPALRLGISPMVNLELGSIFRTQKPKTSQDIVAARMWSYKGIYGNSLYAALRIDI